jgi:hemolysin III
MTIFRLKQLASLDACRGRRRALGRSGELIADAVVHIAGVCFGLVAATADRAAAVYATAIDVATVSVYVAGLLAMLLSATTISGRHRASNGCCAASIIRRSTR